MIVNLSLAMLCLYQPVIIYFDQFVSRNWQGTTQLI